MVLIEEFNKENEEFESVENVLVDKFEKLEKKFIKGVEMKQCLKCGKERINAGLKNGICFACDNQSK